MDFLAIFVYSLTLTQLQNGVHCASSSVFHANDGGWSQQLRYEQTKCRHHLEIMDASMAIRHCSNALQIHEDTTTLCNRANSYLLVDLFEEALDDYCRALSLESDYIPAKDGIERALRLQKEALKPNHYKILGVARFATTKQIVHAYRKAVKRWHPDKSQDLIDKKIAATKFMQIVIAKEVLTDPEKRALFDKGENPFPSKKRGHDLTDLNRDDLIYMLKVLMQGPPKFKCKCQNS